MLSAVCKNSNWAKKEMPYDEFIQWMVGFGEQSPEESGTTAQDPQSRQFTLCTSGGLRDTECRRNQVRIDRGSWMETLVN